MVFVKLIWFYCRTIKVIVVLSEIAKILISARNVVASHSMGTSSILCSTDFIVEFFPGFFPQLQTIFTKFKSYLSLIIVYYIIVILFTFSHLLLLTFPVHWCHMESCIENWSIQSKNINKHHTNCLSILPKDAIWGPKNKQKKKNQN